MPFCQLGCFGELSNTELPQMKKNYTPAKEKKEKFEVCARILGWKRSVCNGIKVIKG